MDPEPHRQTQAFPPSVRGDTTKHDGKSSYAEQPEASDQANAKVSISVPAGAGIAEQRIPGGSTELSSQPAKPFDIFKDVYGVSRTPGSPTSDTENQHRPITSPLTHPNGVSMFPGLSVTEQEAMSRQAFAQAEDNIVADSDEYSSIGDAGSDAGYGSDNMSTASTSIGSSVRDYMFENGRRYHSFRAGAYNFPNDDIEQEREDMKHAMVRLLSGQKLHFAPIDENPQNILDIGTGTGIWAIEMGEQYPSAHVLGIDLSPIQPTWLPPNVHFMVDDVESPWLHPQNHFDYVHSRHTVQGIKDWPQLFSNALQHIKPGGWMELQEIHHYPHHARTGDAVPPHEHPVAQYWTYINEGLAQLGVDFPAAAGGKLATKMQAAGFVNVTERIFHVPLGTWPKNQVLKTVGLYWRTILTDGLQAIALGPMSRGMGWSREQIEVFLVENQSSQTNQGRFAFQEITRTYQADSPIMMLPGVARYRVAAKDARWNGGGRYAIYPIEPVTVLAVYGQASLRKES